MTTVCSRWMEDLRIVWAITAKDALDALKNKTTLSPILMALCLILFYRWLPSLESGDLPRLAVYDAGGSQLTEALRESNRLELVEEPSLEGLQSYVADMDSVVLGLVLPPGLDQALASGQELELDGYVVHWAGAPVVSRAQAVVERELAEIAGRPVGIDLTGHTVYTRADSRGLAFLASVTLVMATLAMGIILVPHLVIEEKQSRTMEALLVSPAGAGHLVAGKALAGMLYGLVCAGVVLALNNALVTHWGVAILAAACGSLQAVAMGLLLGSLLEVRQQMMTWVFVLFIPLLIPVFLSIEPQLVPAAVRSVLPYIPTVAVARAVRASFCAQAPLSLYGPPLAIVLAWTAPLLAGVAWAVGRSDR
jgi:ABC-2 type transport system permease protein